MCFSQKSPETHYPNRFKNEKPDTNMGEIIVDEETFLASFGEYNYKMAKKYFAACELNKQIKNFSEITRRINHSTKDVSKKSVSEWLQGRQTPTAIKSLNFLKSINLMPLRKSNNSKFLLFTELSAFLFGDGHLMKHLGGLMLSGSKPDLEKIGSKLAALYDINLSLKHNRANSTITKIKNGKISKQNVNGSCWNLYVGSSPLARLLYLAGVPIGDKVSISTKLPEWVMKGNRETKRTFLSVLFGNELQCPYIRAKNAFTCAQLGFHKIECKENDLRLFLTQIKLLLSKLGISSSSIAVENGRTIRKDGNRSMKLYFSIDSHSPNILRLFKEISFKYAEEKQRRFAKAVETFLQKSEWLKREWELYEKVMRMHESGLGRRTIFKLLQLPQKYFYRINAWIHYGHKPLYYSERSLFT